MTKTGFCTIFEKQENGNDIAITTYPTEEGHTEEEAKDYFKESGLMKGTDFDEKYRVLIR